MIQENRQYDKIKLLEIIENAEKDIYIIGSTIFDLPWEDDKFFEKIKKKFENKDFTINILRESENIIAQYSLITAGQMKDANLETSYSRGNLVSIKDKTIKYLKERLGIDNIEPPEDTYKELLGNIFYTEKRKYLLESYKMNDCEESLYVFIGQCIKNTLNVHRANFFMHKKYINKAIKGDITYISKFTEIIKEKMDSIVKKICEELLEIEVLKSYNDIFSKNHYSDENITFYSTNDKKGYPFIEVNFNVNIENEDFNIPSLILKIDDYIDDFTVTSLDFFDKEWIEEIKGYRLELVEKIKTHETEFIESANYRLIADKKQAVKKATEIKMNKLESYKNDKNKKQRLFIKDCYLPIPVPMIKIDNKLFITHALTKFDNINKFQYVGEMNNSNEKYKSLWFDEFQNYYKVYFESDNGAQKYSTEETAEGDRKEVIDIFNEERVRIGIGPRDAFLSNMSIVKTVVWALIFDRQGRLLIHQRSVNAKDNQGLWDKSVGGHVSTDDLDTIEAVKREITEELFTIENEGQGGYDKIHWIVVNKEKIIYLGDWKTKRFPDLTSLGLSKDEYYTFQLNFLDINKRNFRKEIIQTKRVLPNGDSVEAKCFVDAYLCIVSEDFDITKLYNSKFVLLTPNELKSCVLSKKIKINDKREVDKKGKEEIFETTSDLKYLVDSSIWDDVVTEFSQRIKETFKKGKIYE